jgi:hypothetical protein
MPQPEEWTLECPSVSALREVFGPETRQILISSVSVFA